jgi:MYXO-CTERM domain-containing protein
MDLCLMDCDAAGGDRYCGASKFKNACGRCAAHNCEKRCQDKCGDAEAPKKITTVTECMPACTNACSASCTAKVNTQCQVDCQESTYLECQDQMVKQCETECKDKGGAIFCDGQFVNAANADSCADELLTKLEIDIDIEATAETVGTTTKRAAKDAGDAIEDACSISGVGMPGGSKALGLFAPLAALALWRVRRRRR